MSPSRKSRDLLGVAALLGDAPEVRLSVAVAVGDEVDVAVVADIGHESMPSKSVRSAKVFAATSITVTSLWYAPR